MKKIEKQIGEALEKGCGNIILNGPPGTGKTYSSKEFVKSKNQGVTNYIVQFHPSYDYLDFVEGLRPIKIKDKSTFARVDGIFKEFCRKVIDNELKTKNKERSSFQTFDEFENYYKEHIEKEDIDKHYFIIDEINRGDVAKIFGELFSLLEDDYKGIEHKIPTQYKNLKTYTLIKDVNNNESREPIKLDYFEKGFFIPKSVVIIGTMNDIDRSVSSIDFAFRRRFYWIEISGNEYNEDGINELFEFNNVNEERSKNKVIKSLKKLNELISGSEGKRFGLNKNYEIGYSYVKDLVKRNVKEKDFEEIFTFNLKPLIEEYLRGRGDLTKEFIEKAKRAFIKGE